MLEVDARIVAACMTELQLKEIDESPDSNVLPTTLLNGSRKERQQYLKSIATKVVNRYILDAENVTALLNKVQMSENKEKERSVPPDGDRFKCRFQGCGKTYRYDGKRKRDHEASHGLPTSEPAIIHWSIEIPGSRPPGVCGDYRGLYIICIANDLIHQ